VRHPPLLQLTSVKILNTYPCISIFSLLL
jgi:hypothetical protein